MDTNDVVAHYYRLANAGEWDNFCDLFASNQVMDEQLAGHIEGREALRGIMRSFPTVFAKFVNEPVHAVVNGNQAAVVSHISARTVAGESIEVDVCNYFQVTNGQITYMANFHDSVPFRSIQNR